MDYFPSAEAMAADLEVELLLQADVDRKMLTRKERLSQFTADSTISGHLYGRVREQQARELGSKDLRGRILWLTAPHSTVEHLSWAVGLADQITRQKGLVYLAASSIETLLPARTGVRGEALPDAVQARLRSWLNGSTYAVGTDLEGVRMVVPVTAHDVVGPASAETGWTVLLLDPLPEDYDGPYPKAGSVDAVVLITAFRDHTVSELQESVAGLRRAGHPLLGVVGMGPRHDPEAGGGTPPPTRRSASIWRTEETPPERKESAPPRLVAVPGTLGRSSGPQSADPPETSVPKAADPEETTWTKLGRSGLEVGTSKQGPVRSNDGPPSRKKLTEKNAARTSKDVPPVERPIKDAVRPVEGPPRSGDSPRPIRASTPLTPSTPEAKPRSVPSDAPAARGGHHGRGSSSSRDEGSRGADPRGAKSKRSGPPPEARGVQRNDSSNPLGTAQRGDGASSSFEGEEHRTVWSDLPHAAATPPQSRPAVTPHQTPPANPRADSGTAGREPLKRFHPREPGPASPPLRTTPERQSPERPTPERPTPNRPTPERPTPERPAPNRPNLERPLVAPNVTPLRVTGGGRPGGPRELTSEERSVALLSGWQRERQRRATRGGRAVMWIGSSVILLGLVGAFFLMRPSLIASGRLPGWMAGSSGTGAESGASSVSKKTASRAKPSDTHVTTQLDESATTEREIAEREALLADLRSRHAAAGSAPNDPYGTAPDDPLTSVPSDLPMNEALSPLGSAEDPSASVPGGAVGAAAGDAQVDEQVAEPSPVPQAGDDGARTGFVSDPAALSSSETSVTEAPVDEGRANEQSVTDPLAIPNIPFEVRPPVDPLGSGSAASPEGDTRGQESATPPGPDSVEPSASRVGDDDSASDETAASDGAAGSGGTTPASSSPEGEALATEPIAAEAAVIDPGTAYVVHLGSFRLRREADAEVARLLGLGYDARALHVNVPEKGPWYRVVIGAFATFADARQSAIVLGETTGRTRPNVVGAGGYGAPVPILEESESPGKATP